MTVEELAAKKEKLMRYMAEEILAGKDGMVCIRAALHVWGLVMNRVMGFEDSEPEPEPEITMDELFEGLDWFEKQQVDKSVDDAFERLKERAKKGLNYKEEVFRKFKSEQDKQF